MSEPVNQTTQQGRGGIGSHKHGVSGRSGPSPRTKFMTALDANRLADAQRARRPKPQMWPSVREALANA